MRPMLLALALWAPAALAHPVAFQGSTGFMGHLSHDMTDLEVNHSLRYWAAPSVQLLRFSGSTSRPDYLLGKANFLAKRWNGRDYQANVYLRAGGGHDFRGKGGVFTGGFTADIEDRWRYLLVAWDGIRGSRRTEVTYWRARAGFAPYIGEYDQIHTWLILEANRKSKGDDRVRLVPTLRFFYKNVLWEVGSSLSGEFHLNYIIHI